MGKVRVAVVASYRWYRSSHSLYDNPPRFEDQNILNVPNASMVAGTLASNICEADRAGVPHRLGLTAEVVGRNRVR